MQRAVQSAGLPRAGARQPEHKIREPEAGKRAGEAEVAVDILRYGALQPVVTLILPAKLHRVAAVRPGQRILEGLDLVVGRGVVVVAAAKRHRETGQPADRDDGNPMTW